MKTIHMMIGIPGSGKTTFVKKLASEKGYDVVSTDIVRANHPQMDEKDVWPTVYKMIGDILLEKYNCIFDATNTTKKVRDRFKENVNLYIKDYQIYGYYFPTNYKECIKRVEKRNTQKGELYLPVDVIKSYGENIYPPTYEESFTNSFVMTQMPNLLKGLIDDAYQGYGFYFKSENEEVEEYSGFANINTCEAIRENTNFRLASVTKQFIAYAIMTLVEKNKISLEDTLYDFFPNMPEYTKEITIKNLLNHTSGLLDYEDMPHYEETDENYKQVSDEEVLEFVRNTDRQYFKTGEKYQYSNTAYVLLGLIIQKVANESLEEYLRKEVFEKNGLLNTKLNLEKVTVIKPRAYGHIEQNGKLVLKDQYWCSATLGDGGIYSSIPDLKKWLKVIENLKEPYSQMIKAHTINGISIEYGLGLRVKKLGDMDLIYHCGDTIGTNTIIGYVKKNEKIKYEFILLTNKGGKDTAILIENLKKELGL